MIQRSYGKCRDYHLGQKPAGPPLLLVSAGPPLLMISRRDNTSLEVSLGAWSWLSPQNPPRDAPSAFLSSRWRFYRRARFGQRVGPRHARLRLRVAPVPMLRIAFA